jgi:hypothetical protein
VPFLLAEQRQMITQGIAARAKATRAKGGKRRAAINIERDRRIYDAIHKNQRSPKQVASDESLSASRVRYIAGRRRR